MIVSNTNDDDNYNYNNNDDNYYYYNNGDKKHYCNNDDNNIDYDYSNDHDTNNKNNIF